MASLIRRCDVFLSGGAKILTAVTAGSFKGDDRLGLTIGVPPLTVRRHEIIIYAYPLWYGGERKNETMYGFG